MSSVGGKGASPGPGVGKDKKVVQDEENVCQE